MKRLKTFLSTTWHAKALTPIGLLTRAGLILITFAALHVLGWRDDTRILSGTSLPSSDAVFRGFLYAAAYFAAIILSPILILAAALQRVIKRVVGSKMQRDDAQA